MFKHIKINDFRALKNKSIELANYVTMLSGWNSTGKSTVLALLANASELKLKEGTTYDGKQFKADFSEILKGSKLFDPTEANRLEITWCDEKKNEIIKSFRTTWQKNDDKTGERFRVIPFDKNDGNEAKFPFPIIYLGLSRLYPLGEISSKDIKTKVQKFSSNEDEEWFKYNYNDILSTNDNILEIDNIDVSLATDSKLRKNKSGITTDKYDWQTNSSGQDNLGRILLALLSFKSLKQKQEKKFKGGMLLIDELEASLHPKAQEKLIDLLISQSKKLGIQIVFTTHSLTMIKYFIQKQSEKDTKNLLNYYFNIPDDKLEIEKNVSIEYIEKDLLVQQYKREKKTHNKIVVYTEDPENRWFFKHLLKSQIKKYLTILDIHISCNHLVSLMNIDPEFANRIVVFDGDFSTRGKNGITKNKNNFIELPTNGELESPEKTLRDFILSNKSDEYLSKESKKYHIIKKRFFRTPSINTKGDDSKERELYKKWFNHHKELFEDSKIMKYWIKENKENVDEFQKNFNKVFNHLAQKLSIPLIK